MRTFAVRGSPPLGRAASSVAGRNFATPACGCSLSCGPPQATTPRSTNQRAVTEGPFPADPLARKRYHGAVLLLDERIRADGTHARTWGEAAGERMHLRDDDGTEGALSITALDRVMVRYGLPLDETIALDGDALELAGGHRLRRLRFH